MSQRYYVKDSSGNTIIPVADGSFLTDAMRPSQDECEVYFAFYSDEDASTPATPTAGTINTYGEYETGFALAPSANPTTDATEVSTPIATYTPPILDGLTIRGRVDLSGVTGATHFRAYFFKRA